MQIWELEKWLRMFTDLVDSAGLLGLRLAILATVLKLGPAANRWLHARADK
ncbi:MAG: hypothetical protein AAGB14_12630 [Verrucomicrobiota bacterium]